MPTKSDMMKTTSRMACVISQMSLFDVLANNMSSVSTAPFAGAVADHKDTIIHQENQPYCAPIGEPQLRAFADNDNGQSVNDLPPTGLVTIHKAQGCEFTRKNEEGVKGVEVIPLGETGWSNYPMNEQADLIDAALKKGRQGDRHPLRLCVKLMRGQGLYVNEVIALGEAGISRQLEQGLPHFQGGKAMVVKKPSCMARRILFCLQRLAQRLPELGLGEIDAKQRQAKLERLKLGDEPPPFNSDLVRWGKMNKEERGRERGGSRALEDSTRRGYAGNCRIGLAAAHKLDLTSPAFSIKTLGQIDVAQAVFEMLDEIYTPEMVATVVAAISRVSNDLYGDDPEHTANINYLEGEAARRFPNLGISQAMVEKFDAISSDPVRYRTINNAPKAMLKRADEPGLSAHIEVSRAAAALLMRLKLDHPGLTSTEAAQLDACAHFCSIEGKLSLGLPDRRERGKTRWDPLTGAAEAMFADVMARKARHGMIGTLLYPALHDASHPRNPQVVMAQVYSEFEAATREQLTFKEIRLLMCYRALKKHPDRMEAIAEAARYKSAHTLEAALGSVVNVRRRAA